MLARSSSLSLARLPGGRQGFTSLFLYSVGVVDFYYTGKNEDEKVIFLTKI
jgi:hypothetical protein